MNKEVNKKNYLYLSISDEEKIKQVLHIIADGQKSWEGHQDIDIKAIKKDLLKSIKKGQTIVLENKGEILSVVTWLKEEESLYPRPLASQADVHVQRFYLKRKYWGTGLAEDFLNLLFDDLRQRGFLNVRLWTPKCAKRAQGFYKKEGWLFSGREIYYLELKRLEYTKQINKKQML